MMSPRKAFSLAIRSDLKVDWTLAWWVNGTDMVNGMMETGVRKDEHKSLLLWKETIAMGRSEMDETSRTAECP